MNRCMLITGSTDGIGKAAITLAKREKIAKCVLKHGRRNVKETDYIKADFENLQEVRSLAEFIRAEYPDLNVLVNNAGVFEPYRRLTKDGFEATFQINYLAHFLLTYLLLPVLIKNAPSIIINVSSMVHANSFQKDNLQGEIYYDGYEAYSRSKLLNILHAYKLHRLYNHLGINVYAVHPGVIDTKLLRRGWGIGGASPEQGARNILTPLLEERYRDRSGIYIEAGIERPSKPITYDERLQDWLWDYTAKLLKEKGVIENEDFSGNA